MILKSNFWWHFKMSQSFSYIISARDIFYKCHYSKHVTKKLPFSYIFKCKVIHNFVVVRKLRSFCWGFSCWLWGTGRGVSPIRLRRTNRRLPARRSWQRLGPPWVSRRSREIRWWGRESVMPKAEKRAKSSWRSTHRLCTNERRLGFGDCGGMKLFEY